MFQEHFVDNSKIFRVSGIFNRVLRIFNRVLRIFNRVSGIY